MNFEKLLRPNIRQLKPYTSAREIHAQMEGIFLDANENSLEPVLGEGLNRYPDPKQSSLKRKISKIKNIDPARIFLGNGSDEPIDLLIRAFCEPNQDEILICTPTYGMYQVCADINAVNVSEVDFSEEFQIRLEEVLKAISEKTKIIYLCSPNNPTGNLLNKEKIKQLLTRFEGVLVVDEAYIDFADDEGWLPELGNYDNLIVLQTFSKAWGLAASRVGMAYAHPGIIGVLNKIKYPYNINGLSQEILINAIDKLDKKNFLVEQILKEKSWLYERLSKLKMVDTIFPSDANFFLIRFNDAKKVYKTMLEKRILLRDRSHHELTKNCIRITVGSHEENQMLIKYLQQMDK
jgi:histidinol-phosphate aminotransferase